MLKIDQLFIKHNRRLLQNVSCLLANDDTNVAYCNCRQQYQKNATSRYSTKQTYRRATSQSWPPTIFAILGACVGASIGGAYLYKKARKNSVAALTSKVEVAGGGHVVEGLPLFSLKQVGEHASVKDRIWVTYGQGVYDITEFVEQHPGGDRIMMAAGGSVEPFWMMYGVHKQPEIVALLETFRIGNLSLEESKESTRNMDDPYSGDPIRHPVLHPASIKPFNAEPPAVVLADTFITPVDVFYVRNHLPVPDVDPVSYRLTIEGLGIQSTELTLDDIKRFPKHSVTAAIQCAGNRRKEMSKVKPVKGLSWNVAAIGNGTFTGARLYDVLSSLGVKEDHPNAQHVQFEGLDLDPANVPYGASIPFEKAMNGKGDVLLAYEMNGEPLSRDHGFPLRVVVPGTVGARNVKWLGAIYVSDEESQSHWQQNDYKGFCPSVDWDTVDFTTSPAIQTLPVTSAICQPQEGETVNVKNGTFLVKGYAWSGGGNKVVRVDVTADGGKTWHVANLTDQDTNKPPYHWAWTLWQVQIPITGSSSSSSPHNIELWAKAVDSSYNTQPESFEYIWNLRGVLANAYHKINVNLTF